MGSISRVQSHFSVQTTTTTDLLQISEVNEDLRERRSNRVFLVETAAAPIEMWRDIAENVSIFLWYRMRPRKPHNIEVSVTDPWLKHERIQ